MKKLNSLKITMLFLLTLCACSIITIRINKIYSEHNQKVIKENIEKVIQENEINKILEKVAVFPNGEIGLIVIPSLNIEAPIKEGTTADVLKYSVGHFENTKLWDGNVALASHNGGSYAHYFSDIKQLKNGEEIIYITNMGERRYEVVENKIIKETNVEILKDTEENIITLITCVKGQRNKRQCIIGKEIN